MFGSAALEVAIGLMFVYLMASLACTALAELIAAYTRARATMLKRGIRTLLDGSAMKEDQGTPGSSRAERFLQHPRIRSLYDSVGPSYIPSHAFASVLLGQVLAEPPGSGVGASHRTLRATRPSLAEIRAAILDIKDEHLRVVLLALANDAANDLDPSTNALTKVQDQVEIWFNDTMDRVAGWYKRRLQAILLGLALLVCVVLNLDTLMIVRTLAADPTLRAAMIVAAEGAIRRDVGAGARDPAGRDPPATSPATMASNQPGLGSSANLSRSDLDTQIARLRATGLPLGWRASDSRRGTALGADEPVDPRTFPNSLGGLIEKLFGLLISALAVSLGAPFWFDLLNRFVGLRSSGRAPEESPRPPKEEPRPRAPEATPPLRPSMVGRPAEAARGGMSSPSDTGGAGRRLAGALRHRPD